MTKNIARRNRSSSSGQLELPLNSGEARDSNCERCGNWESAETVCMWGTGPKHAKVMVIYDAPGDLEGRNGKHLQGRPGKILNEMLEAAGGDRGQCYITSLVK